MSGTNKASIFQEILILSFVFINKNNEFDKNCRIVQIHLTSLSFLVVMCRCVLLGVTWQCCWIHTHTTRSSTIRTPWTSLAMRRCSWRGSSTCSSHITSQPKQKQWWKSNELFMLSESSCFIFPFSFFVIVKCVYLWNYFKSHAVTSQWVFLFNTLPISGNLFLGLLVSLLLNCHLRFIYLRKQIPVLMIRRQTSKKGGKGHIFNVFKFKV